MSASCSSRAARQRCAGSLARQRSIAVDQRGRRARRGAPRATARAAAGGAPRARCRLRPRNGRRAAEHREAEHAERVQVAAAVDRVLADELLGRHVVRRADVGPASARHRSYDGRAATPKSVSSARPSRGEQHVLGLEVAVHHALAVRVVSASPARAQHAPHLARGQRALAPQPVGQRLAVHVGHHELGHRSPAHLASPTRARRRCPDGRAAPSCAPRGGSARAPAGRRQLAAQQLDARPRGAARGRAPGTTTPMPPRPSSRTTWYCAPSRSAIQARSTSASTAVTAAVAGRTDSESATGVVVAAGSSVAMVMSRVRRRRAGRGGAAIRPGTAYVARRLHRLRVPGGWPPLKPGACRPGVKRYPYDSDTLANGLLSLRTIPDCPKLGHGVRFRDTLSAHTLARAGTRRRAECADLGVCRARTHRAAPRVRSILQEKDGHAVPMVTRRLGCARDHVVPVARGGRHATPAHRRPAPDGAGRVLVQRHEPAA